MFLMSRGKACGKHNTTESLQRLFPPPKTHTSIAATGPVVSPTAGPFLVVRLRGHPWPPQPRRPPVGGHRPSGPCIRRSHRKRRLRAAVAAAWRRRRLTCGEPTVSSGRPEGKTRRDTQPPAASPTSGRRTPALRALHQAVAQEEAPAGGRGRRRAAEAHLRAGQNSTSNRMPNASVRLLPLSVCSRNART